MIRRSLLAVAMVAVSLGPMAGCGLVVRKIEGEPLLVVGTVTRSYPESSHRVALAALEAMRAELASADLARDSEFIAEPDLRTLNGKTLKEGDLLPPNYPAVWVNWTFQGQPIRDLMTLAACHFAGQTRDGRPVRLTVLVRAEGALATVHVDRRGDPALSKALLDRIADRLAHPAYPPGSAEEAAAFQAFFGGVRSREAIPTLRPPPAPSSALHGRAGPGV